MYGDLPPEVLCDNHLLGEHSEIHAIWSILTEDKEGYRNHPEVRRWEGKLKALHERHEKVVGEMESRGYSESSPLDDSLAEGEAEQDEHLDTLSEQREILKEKGCDCNV